MGISTLLDPGLAAQQAVDVSAERLGSARAELMLVLASAAHGAGLPDLVRRARAVAGCPIVGGSVEGIVAPGVEVSSYPAVLALSLSGVDADSFFLPEAGGDESRAGGEIAARVGQPGPEDLVVLMADSQSVDVTTLSRALPEGLDGATVLGTGAAAAARGRPLLWAGRELESDALAGWVLRGAAPRLTVAQAGRPVTPPLRVTRARGNWIVGLEGRPALEVYEETIREQGLVRPDESSPPLLVGLSEERDASGRAGAGPDGGGWLVRNVVGIDPERGAISVPEPVASGRQVVLVRLDAEAAHADFVERLDGLADPAAGFGLYFNCQARGASLFGEPGVEATELANAFADCPVAGVSGPFQIAPLERGRPPSLLTYAGALAVVG